MLSTGHTVEFTMALMENPMGQSDDMHLMVTGTLKGRIERSQSYVDMEGLTEKVIFQ